MHERGCVWHCLLWDGRLPRESPKTPSSAHLVLAILASSRQLRARGAAAQCSHTAAGGVWPWWVLLLHQIPS